jgi:hypothetical protein
MKKDVKAGKSNGNPFHPLLFPVNLKAGKISGTGFRPVIMNSLTSLLLNLQAEAEDSL